MTILRREPRRYAREAEPKSTGAEMLALPKPRFVPKGERADRSVLAIGIAEPARDKDYLAFVRSELCAVYGTSNHECGGSTEAAHLVVDGKGRKADDYLTAPLCTNHHRIQHDMGIVTFQLTYGVNLWEVSLLLLVRWVRRITK